MPYRTLDLAASFATNTSALTSIQFAAAALPALPFEEEEYYEDGSVFMSEDDMDVGMGMDMEEEEEEEEEFSNCEQVCFAICFTCCHHQPFWFSSLCDNFCRFSSPPGFLMAYD
eukprot:m.5887 g.5887  ORF g.5887 m.5887 type:complete len:114 (+) comp4652_c0_seq1:289-630(+)